MLVHKGGQIKNWGGKCRDVTPVVSNIQRALQVFYHDYNFLKSKSETGDNKKINRMFFVFLIFINKSNTHSLSADQV